MRPVRPCTVCKHGSDAPLRYFTAYLHIYLMLIIQNRCWQLPQAAPLPIAASLALTCWGRPLTQGGDMVQAWARLACPCLAALGAWTCSA